MGKRKDMWERMQQTWRVEAEAISRLPDVLDRGSLLRCASVLAKCRGRIVTAGVGTSAAAARKVAHTMCCVGRPAFFLSPGDALHGALGAVGDGDVAILLSKGGKSAEINGMVGPLRAKGALIVAVTANRRSGLARNADVVVAMPAQREADPFDMLATTSTLSVLAVFDAISVALMSEAGYTKRQFSRIHPGGAVGLRLRSPGRKGPGLRGSNPRRPRSGTPSEGAGRRG